MRGSSAACAKALRTLKGYTGRVLRDLGRKLGAVPEGPLRTQIEQRMALVTRLLWQTPKRAGKIYALHEPEVDCIVSLGRSGCADTSRLGR